MTQPPIESHPLVARLASADRIVAPVILFIGSYVAMVLLLWVVLPAAGQWTGLAAVVVATAVVVGVVERGRWKLGLFVPFKNGARELLLGLAIGSLLVGSCAFVVAMSSPVDHSPGSGFPWSELLVVLLPAVLHEELLFRGYAFQKLLHWRRWPALLSVAILFAALHLGNPAVSHLGLVNIFLGGLLLGVAYEVYQRLWLPIGLHLSWNVMVGPVTGHEVSGYTVGETVLQAHGEGSAWLTGGDFGLEGSVVMTACELTALALLLAFRRRRLANETGAVSPSE